MKESSACQKIARSIGITVMMATCLAQIGHASVAIYVGKNLTRDGDVLLAGFGDEPSSHWLTIVPRRPHDASEFIAVGGTSAAEHPGELTEIPQVRETFRYIAMDYSFYRGLPAPLTNGGMNEYGVAVRDVALYSRRELIDMTPKPQRGLNYSDVARIALERAHTAREAVDIATSLIERYGDFTYGGNSHIFADPKEGWVLLEFAGGKGLWVAHRLGPNDVWLNWRGYNKNGYIQTVPADLEMNPDYLASKNFISFAVEHGWYKPDSGKPFNAIEVYCKQESFTEATALEAHHVEAAVRLATPKVESRHLMQILHEVGKDSSGYGQVAELRANIDSSLRTIWIAPGPPVTAAFVPWRLGVQTVPPEYRRHRYLTAGEAERTIDIVAQQGLESTRYADHAVNRLLYLVDEHREAFLPEVSSSLSAFESREIDAQEGIERTASVLMKAQQVELVFRYLTEQTHWMAADGLHLIENLAIGIEARTQVQYGIHTPESADH